MITSLGRMTRDRGVHGLVQEIVGRGELAKQSAKRATVLEHCIHEPSAVAANITLQKKLLYWVHKASSQHGVSV